MTDDIFSVMALLMASPLPNCTFVKEFIPSEVVYLNGVCSESVISQPLGAHIIFLYTKEREAKCSEGVIWSFD